MAKLFTQSPVLLLPDPGPSANGRPKTFTLAEPTPLRSGRLRVIHVGMATR